MTAAIEARGLVKRFGKTKALDGIDLTVEEGRVLGVLGPNGAGKTTAVRILATLLKPDGGTATVSGLDVVHQATAVRRKIGLTGQFASVDEDLTGMQNLVMVGQLLDLTTRQAKIRASELLAEFDLTDAAGRLAKTYSGGMRRRLDLSASLIGRPAVVFLDEPTTGLDPAKRDDVWDMIRALVKQGTTILLTTQYLEEADALANEITVIDHGSIIAHDTPQGLKRQVGGQTLEVRPTDVASLPRVRELMIRFGTREPEQPAPDLLSVPVTDESALTQVVAALSAENISVSELSLRLPSLDEVFYSLTGQNRTAADATTTKGAAA
ncbi:daunorubicin/doxorubicin resistance ABC transporter ATP-binding protein DrrA [Subtercola boreus]|uniref:Daunorubicin/doxorubicin resistance ABC transporter ATP-binding protein DrrA n=1 Tax=Subtercola boreus TaxID=120213 RepID=A0A3E0VTP3_9MICO|nr:ATP-binding cassette domain-containing protein [Subtercola boreus]RFA13000.1 daunorubicin/doxorubicin resistance ABC transporter ATP-binding protein DrrA [Subtercola boreus]